MSPRRVALKRLGFAVALLALLLGGCIFSPTEKPAGQQPPQIDIPKSEVELIAKLAQVYQERSYPKFENLFPTAEDNAAYLFILNDPPLGTPPNWDVTEELRIHRRMFEPENTPPGEAPVPPEIWLQGITITLSPNRDFAERPDLYASPTNPDGLDPSKWRASEAQYHANLFFDTQTDTDFRVNGDANFVVINDLTKAVGEDRKFLIFRWEDLGGPTKPMSDAVPAI